MSAIDLPDKVAELFTIESVASHQGSNNRVRGMFDIVAGALAGQIQTNFSEVGVLEGRATSGVMATPIAAPSTG